MTTHPRNPLHLTARGAAASLALVALTTCGGAAGATAADAAAPSSSEPTLISYAGGESPGVTVKHRAQAKRLVGSPRSFKRFVGRLAERLSEDPDCQAVYGVTVEAVRTDGYAVGGVNQCGGYAALWAEVDGSWRQIAGTQDTWRCGVLKKYVVPSDIAGDSCYTYASKHPHAKRYHQD